MEAVVVDDDEEEEGVAGTLNTLSLLKETLRLSLLALLMGLILRGVVTRVAFDFGGFLASEAAGSLQRFGNVGKCILEGDGWKTDSSSKL